MSYPIDYLKQGGRFYLCWLADTCPLRFTTISRRQLYSQDIRKICDDLLEVTTNESSDPAARFSLRLSSQLLRGLAVQAAHFDQDITSVSINAVNTRHLKEAVKRLKPRSSSGPDGILGFLAKDCIAVLEGPLLHLYNLSVTNASGYHHTRWIV
ncbi:unnamed protein product [Parnassius apollo]|uniref:(apollo) hypothetical protein n=1 Tax=Parnassius apollo TaxID=110799 RepID=A0A8S3W5S0_PARAO|nr:unnamed protein product [Parnassius apollo]